MSDDSFIREVDEELRSDRMQDAWKKYGKIVIAVAVSIVLATGGYRYYQYYTKSQANSAGDQFIKAIELSENGDREAAIKALENLSENGSPSYSALALLRLAAEKAAGGDFKGAVADYDQVAANNEIDQSYRDIANLRAGLLMVDQGSLSDVVSRVEGLSGPGAPFRHTAREALGLAYWKARELDASAKLFQSISVDAAAPAALRGRANLMLDMIAADGGPARTN